MMSILHWLMMLFGFMVPVGDVARMRTLEAPEDTSSISVAFNVRASDPAIVGLYIVPKGYRRELWQSARVASFNVPAGQTVHGRIDRIQAIGKGDLIVVAIATLSATNGARARWSGIHVSLAGRQVG